MHSSPRIAPTWKRSLCVLAAVGLVACGGGSGDGAAFIPVAGTPATDPAPTVPTAPVGKLAGTVAVGAPVIDGTLSVRDADGRTVVSDVPVGLDGRYANVDLAGRGPWRLEACGQAGGRWICMGSLVRTAGTGNVTPLTDAMVTLGGVDPDRVARTQGTLRTALAQLMSDAGLGQDFDFVTGELVAGSRTGYDRLLDAIGVSSGEDGTPFVQITPRLGSGNLYLRPNAAPEGELRLDPGARSTPLAGLDPLFRRLSEAITSRAACIDPTSGLAANLAQQARLTRDDGTIAVGPAAVAAALCAMLDGGDGEPASWGSTLLPPVLGRCEFDRPVPVCRTSVALRSSDGTVRGAGDGLGVSFEGGQWRFLGEVEPMPIRASTRVQRDRRVDGPRAVDTYSRAFGFEIPARTGLACARVSQRDATGALLTLAYYKPHGTVAAPSRLSLWTRDPRSNQPSLDASAGTTRAPDDSWAALPDGTAGDAAVRNFHRAGRMVVIELYSDAGCQTAASVDGRSRFEVEMIGVPPVWGAMPALPWPEPSEPTLAAMLRGVAAPPQPAQPGPPTLPDPGATPGAGPGVAPMPGAVGPTQPGTVGPTPPGTAPRPTPEAGGPRLPAAGAATQPTVQPGPMSGDPSASALSWAFPRDAIGIDEATVCMALDCPPGSPDRVGSARPRPGATSAALPPPPAAPSASAFRMLTLTGRLRDGSGLQANFIACPARPVGQPCR